MREMTVTVYQSDNGNAYDSQSKAVAADVAWVRSYLERDLMERLRKFARELKAVADPAEYDVLIGAVTNDLRVMVEDATARIKSAEPVVEPAPEPILEVPLDSGGGV